MIDIFIRRLDVYADLAYIQIIGTEETDMTYAAHIDMAFAARLVFYVAVALLLPINWPR